MSLWFVLINLAYAALVFKFPHWYFVIPGFFVIYMITAWIDKLNEGLSATLYFTASFVAGTAGYILFWIYFVIIRVVG